MRTLITVTGNLTNQPVARVTKEGVSVVEFGLASNTRKQDRVTGLWEDGETTFFAVTCWRRLADNVVDSLHRGDPVVVQGRFSTREYVRSDGTPKVELRLEALAMGPDLGRSTAIVRRTSNKHPEEGTPAAGVQVPAQGWGPDGGDPRPDDGASGGTASADRAADPEDEPTDGEDTASESLVLAHSGPLVPAPAAKA